MKLPFESLTQKNMNLDNIQMSARCINSPPLQQATNVKDNINGSNITGTNDDTFLLPHSHSLGRS